MILTNNCNAISFQDNHGLILLPYNNLITRFNIVLHSFNTLFKKHIVKYFNKLFCSKILIFVENVFSCILHYHTLYPLLLFFVFTFSLGAISTVRCIRGVHIESLNWDVQLVPSERHVLNNIRVSAMFFTWGDPFTHLYSGLYK